MRLHCDFLAARLAALIGVLICLGAGGCSNSAQQPSTAVNPAGSSGTSPTGAPPAAASPRVTSPVAAALLVKRDQLDGSLWRDEVLAQRYEDYFIDLWDRIRAGDDRLGVVRTAVLQELVVPAGAPAEKWQWDIERVAFSGDDKTYTREEFVQQLDALVAAGYKLEEAEFHHSTFVPPTADKQATSVVAFVAHLARPEAKERVVVRGDLNVVWERTAAGGKEMPIPQSIAIRNAHLLRRVGEPAFREIAKFEYKIDPSNRAAPGTPHPFLAQDLNRDGRTDFVSGSFNRVYWNELQADGSVRWREEPLVADTQDISRACAGLFADFNGDGRDDLLLALSVGLPRVYLADAQGKFTSPALPIALPEKLILPTGVTAGDVDRDGDLDLWIGQYKPAYAAGNMPTPYYDANDGFPGYLLLGDGQGHFVDGTPGSGLDAKRFRRNFSSSLADLNGDGLLDLVTVNDFAGYDLYYGDGQGHFRDVTGTAVPDLDAFGMAHTFGDYNDDGLLDIYVIGMSSTTARRLERLGVGRDDLAAHTKARPGMGYGNRTLLADGKGGFTPAPFSDQIARTGWSWGCTTFDADNDGRQEIFVCNGHTSGKSCRDYCTTYWTHDIYSGSSKESAELDQLFSKVLFDVRTKQISWNGFEHDVLWFHRGEGAFANVAYLMGVASEADCRSALSDDVDGDGRVDLVFEESDWKNGRHVFHVMRNEWPTQLNWIGLQAYELGGGLSPQGAKILCKTPDRQFVAVLASGHSTLCQHSGRVHFGLGDAKEVEWLEVHWPGGRVSRLERPELGKYHDVRSVKAE